MQSRDLAELAGQIQKRYLSACVCSGGGHNFLGRQQGEGWDFLGPKFERGQNFWAIVFVNLPALPPPVINDRSLTCEVATKAGREKNLLDVLGVWVMNFCYG